MISRLFGLGAKRHEPEARLPADLRLYAIGDIHGRLDLLDQLLAAIDADDRSRPARRSVLIFLGDLIDRGPESSGVIDRAILLQRERECRFLLGNHEEVFLKALRGDLKTLSFFNRIGGRETILSYGISEAEYAEADFPELLALLEQRVPASHVAFLEACEDLVILGDYAFVHAGVRPEQPLAEQQASDLRWIRAEFLDHRGELEKVVVHGHTVTEQVEVRRHRIGLDTGAYRTGKLTAMGFEGGERWVIDTA
jgi:serine/threonine protein phosphatase 1